MTRVWRVGSFLDDISVVLRFGASIPPDAVMVAPEQAAWSCLRWFSESGSSRHVLYELYEAVGHASPSRPDADLSPIREVVREAFARGTLQAYRVPEALGAVAGKKEPEKPAGSARPVEVKTFIAIQLLTDDDPPQPVPFKRYRIELPDRSTREGILDENGQARVGGLDPGVCKVSFPEFSDDDWRAA
jgi:hypothetical protein